MRDTRQPGWDDHTAKTDARMIELGLAEPGILAPGSGIYYGDIMPPEWYEANAVRDLGLMSDGSFRGLDVAQAEQNLLHARDDLEVARQARDHEPSLVNLNAACHTNIAVHHAEQGLSEAEATEQQREAAGEPEPQPVAGRGPTDEELAERSFWIQQHAGEGTGSVIPAARRGPGCRTGTAPITRPRPDPTYTPVERLRRTVDLE